MNFNKSFDNMNKQALNTFTSGFSATNSGSNGMSGGGGRRTRCTDRFVKYPYPKQLITNY